MKKQLLVLGTGLLLFSCTGQKQLNTVTAVDNNPVIAHRGAFKKNGFPENSIAALNEAIRLKCAGSEFDVRMTADDSLIVNHDPHYNGLEIEKVSYAQLAQTKLSNGETLPTLREYLQAGKKNNTTTLLVLEIKPSGISKERGQKLGEKCVAMVRELGTAAMTVYISFDYDILKKIRAIEPTAITQHLNGDKSPAELKADGITGADYHFSVFKKNPEWITAAKAQGIVLNAWTVNNREDMEWLLSNGFEYITTNEPELLFEVLKERKGKAQP
ncbi:glycerophosphodiester phosphodiesterase [Flavisolibacter sp. BT320]|nr:glycerophosphodiester phosphodiesterase [Flavisolibacter longurius]